MSLSVFKGKIAVITGAGSGIGRALALQLASEGANLALADINVAGLEETRSLLPASTKTTIHPLDVGDRSAFQAFVKDVISEHQQVDIVINNAGIIRMHSMMQGTYEDYEKTLNINVWGVIYGCKEFLPYLQRRPQAWLCNISSVSGLIGLENYTSYALSKFGVRGLTESLRNELRHTNINVSCVHPGGVSTNIQKDAVCTADASESSKKLAKVLEGTTAEKAADIILTGIAKGRKRILVGFDAKLTDIIARLFPSSYGKMINRLEKFFS